MIKYLAIAFYLLMGASLYAQGTRPLARGLSNQ
jgi:hypothetical protein